MQGFRLGDDEVLLVYPRGGEIVAIQPRCPHQDVPLGEGEFDGNRLVCRAHRWECDPAEGRAVNPDDCRLKRYRTKIDGDAVFVDLDDEY